jgi:rhomboid protease GluP
MITASMLTAPPTRGPIDFERGMRLVPPLILTLILANIAAFAWEVASGALLSRGAIIEAGALSRDHVLAGEWSRLVTAMFLHGGPDHLIGNMIVLYIVGIGCEHALGWSDTAVVYFTAGITGFLLSMAMSPGPSVGASGAIFGVAGALSLVLVRYRDRFHLRDKRIGVVLAFWAAYQLLMGLASPFVDNYGHLGGLAGGLMTGALMKPRLLRQGARG